jgi:SAM-dependent methyltransferase
MSRTDRAAPASSPVAQEQEFFDDFWAATRVRRITERLELPGIELAGKRVLICSCGSGEEPVRAVNAGAREVHAFDISRTAVRKALQVAEFNRVSISAQVMDFHALAYPTGYFDVIYGSAILHHIDCERAGRETLRCLAPGGTAYFAENSDRNPLLRWARRLLFGTPGDVQRSRRLFFRRYGTADEYPLTDDELAVLAAIFDGELRVRIPRFVFFELLALHGWRQQTFQHLMRQLDSRTARLLPPVARYSFVQDVIMARSDDKGRRPRYPDDAIRVF